MLFFLPLSSIALLCQLRFSVSAILAGYSRFCAPLLPEPAGGAVNGHESGTTTNGAAVTAAEGPAVVSGKAPAASFANGKRLSERDELGAASAQQQQSAKKRRSSSTLSYTSDS